MTVVTAAVIESEGRILICRRRFDQRHPGKWEFPGGKVEPGEDSRQGLRRELGEELGIEARIDAEITRYRYRYSDNQVELVFYRVSEFTGEPDGSQFEEIRWVTPGELPAFDFLEGDIEFVRELAARRG